MKLQHYLADADKAYEATVAFGAATDTEDAEGRVVETRRSGRRSPRPRSAAALPRFVGEIAQVPPMYSAVRVGGRRLHEVGARRRVGRARAAPRAGGRADLLALEPAQQPEPARDGGILRGCASRLVIRCGKGTYVRTLAADLGRALGVPAHLAALRRTEASGFRIDEAIPLSEAEALAPDALRERVIPMGSALRVLPPCLSPGTRPAISHTGARCPGRSLRRRRSVRSRPTDASSRSALPASGGSAPGASSWGRRSRGKPTPTNVDSSGRMA